MLNSTVYCYFINTDIRIRGNDGSSREIDSLTRKISSETTVFAFQSLTKRSIIILILYHYQNNENSPNGGFS